MVPTRSQTPINASSPVETIGEIPKSPHSVTKCGIRPKLETPQTKNVKASTQKTMLDDAIRSAPILSATALLLGIGGVVRTCSSPYGGSPTSDGRSRENRKNASATTPTMPADGANAMRHP
jgi:hypothetical protein